MMWPFKKPLDTVSVIPFDEFEKMHIEGYRIMSIAAKTLAQYEKIKRERRGRGENKMKLSVGSEYIISGAKHKCTSSFQEYPYNGETKFKIGNWNYYEDGRPCSGIAPKIEHELLRPTTPPLTLIPGELYAMDNGKVEICRESAFGGVRLGNFYYEIDGSPVFHNGPRPLHRLRVNEHMKEPELVYTSDFVRRMGVTIPAMQGESVSTGWDAARSDAADALVYSFITTDDKRLFSQANRRENIITEILAQQADGQRAEALAAMPRVTYRNVHSETEACKREVVIPAGFEDVTRIPGAVEDMAVLLMPGNGLWVSYRDDRVRCGPIIRPIKKPFKVDGPGWYRSRKGSWYNLKYPVQLENWNRDGSLVDEMQPYCSDLIARATAEQAQILDAL